MTITTALKEALNDAVSSGKFIDTKIVLFSRRDSSGRVCEPKALYANSHVLKSVPYFNDLLSGPFSESGIKDFSETVDDGEFAEDYGYLSDSDLEEDWDFDSPAPPTSQSQPRRKGATYGRYKEHVRMGKVVNVQDVAFITFQAFLLYLYTDSIEFAPFGSEEKRRSRSHEIAWTSEGEIPKPSPKSIYRLADKYDVPKLKKAALESIQNRLQYCDIVQEAFSRFTSRYSEVRTMEVNYLSSIISSGSEEGTKTIREKLEQKMDSYAAGELDHATDVISLILEKKAGELGRAVEVMTSTAGNLGQPQNPSFIPSYPQRGSALPGASLWGWDMRSPLIKSIREGYLLDRRYWARRTRGGEIEPIYFSDSVSRAGLPGLDTLLGRQLGLGGRLDKSGEDEYTDDSDHEDEPEPGEPVSENINPEKKREQKLYPVLKSGSLVAWKSLFFCFFTGEIQFAPLRSQGVERRSRWILSNAIPGYPTPCSPKTMYMLTKKMNCATVTSFGPAFLIKSQAIKNIEAGLTEDNIVAETFSSFASQNPEIIEMEWKLLGAKFKTEKTTASALELIKGMEGGNAAHRANVLKFGLHSALQHKGPAQRTFASLRSTHEQHPANNSRDDGEGARNSLTTPFERRIVGITSRGRAGAGS